jgi:hypothetical protein
VIGFRTTASLKCSITAAMAKAPPSRSYRLDSVISSSWLVDKLVGLRVDPGEQVLGLDVAEYGEMGYMLDLLTTKGET